MNEHGRHITNPAGARSTSEPAGEAPERRELILMSSGARAFAVYADEADGVTRGLEPTPLPGAPRAVRGVVCVRGRMRTVLDPLALLPAHTDAPGDDAGDFDGEPEQTAAHFIVTLRGDEQLALAVEQVNGIVELAADAPEGDARAGALIRGTLTHDGQQLTLLDPSNMFEAAMRGTDRRRQRLKP